MMLVLIHNHYNDDTWLYYSIIIMIITNDVSIDT